MLDLAIVAIDLRVLLYLTSYINLQKILLKKTLNNKIKVYILSY